jgi:hypothetical protein
MVGCFSGLWFLRGGQPKGVVVVRVENQGRVDRSGTLHAHRQYVIVLSAILE